MAESEPPESTCTRVDMHPGRQMAESARRRADMSPSPRGGPMAAPTLDRPLDEAALQQHFEATIAADRRIEPRDWMPEGYRRTLIPPIAPHAPPEVIGVQPGGELLVPPPHPR